MSKRRLTFTFNEEEVAQPIIYNLGQQFNVVTNIRQANITEYGGWINVELEGENQDIEDGIAWAISRGVRVDETVEI
jgi:ABC-type methionine transport system ATPase subunit